MRISDWSSDVCSSDLAGLLGKAVDHAEAEAGAVVLALGGEEGLESLVEDVGRNPGAVVGDRQHDVVARHDVEVQGGIVGIELLVHRLDDRKSVVQGKSVSVRVDLGGGRLINKKRKWINTRRS